MSKDETEARFNDILEFSEIGDFIDTEVKHYSSGMYSRLGFSVAVHTELDVLLVDEILSVGDAAFRAKCAERMQLLREQGKTMFVVSHSAGQVKQLCERGVVLQRGQIVFDGPIDEAVAYTDPRAGKREMRATSHPVGEQVAPYYASLSTELGSPLHAEVRTEANGGGWFQRFQRGMITVSDSSGKGYAIHRGSFLERYLHLDGPLGPWGFLADTVRGEVADGDRRLDFQHGQATFTPEDGVSFFPSSPE